MKNKKIQEIKQKLLNMIPKDEKNKDLPILIVIGKWIETKTINFKFQEPSPKEMLLKIFENDKRFKIVIINEEFTTKSCFACNKISLGNTKFWRNTFINTIKHVGKRFHGKVFFLRFILFFLFLLFVFSFCFYLYLNTIYIYFF